MNDDVNIERWYENLDDEQIKALKHNETPLVRLPSWIRKAFESMPGFYRQVLDTDGFWYRDRNDKVLSRPGLLYRLDINWHRPESLSQHLDEDMREAYKCFHRTPGTDREARGYWTGVFEHALRMSPTGGLNIRIRPKTYDTVHTARFVGKNISWRVFSCEYVSVSDLIPSGWEIWFWEQIADYAPFSWGDNDKSLVSASSFADHCEERLDDSPESERLIESIRNLGEVYIDLES